ncbi:MAG: iron ABC transporter permease [Chloroflexi bacterium]|nr:MAG: iron ABC transporter permease [Chloroflexota bacterium]
MGGHHRGAEQAHRHDRAEPHQPAGPARRRGRGSLREARASRAVPLVRTVTVFALLVAALAVSAAAGILVGAVAIAPGDVLSALLGADSTSGTIIRELRLPRVLGAALVGGALAAAGALLQGMLRNPLADPFVTGTSAGASLGAVLAVALGFEPALVPVAAFVGATGAIALVWRLARLGGRTTVLTVLLAGVVLTSFAGALVTLVLVSSDRLALRLRAVLGWLQGGISVISWSELAVAAVVVAVGVIGALLLAPRIDAYAFGEETAAALGVDLDRTTAAVLARILETIAKEKTIFPPACKFA